MIASIGLLSPTAHIWISTYRIQERVKCLEFLTPTLLHSSYSLVSGRPTAVQSRVNLHSVHLSTCLYSCDGVMQHYIIITVTFAKTKASLSCISIIIEDDVIQDFLWVDSCAKVADKVHVHVYVCARM